MNSILEYSYEEISTWVKERSYPAYRAKQIMEWVYGQKINDWKKASNLPHTLVAELAEHFLLRQGVLQEVISCRDGTKKLLIRWQDGTLTETVYIHDQIRRTVCISTQIGCPVQCAFCASGLSGLERSLTASEIVEQLFWVQTLLEPAERISNVVIMGMGEPLANYTHTLKAIQIINADWGLGIGARHITVSTIGLPEFIRKLAHEPFQITLAVSLHAGNDELRSMLIPWANKFKLEEIFAAIEYYYQQTHREVTLEYIMLAGVNASLQDAEQLAHWAKRSRCNVNLINYNEVSETGYKPAAPEAIQAFMQRLTKLGVNVHLRKSRGREKDAACGQLRRKKTSRFPEID
jgi:23S rRNA (adenine2503-C2)-methyltransferase